MWRRIHSWLGLVLALLVLALALSGSLLATKPLYDAYRAEGSLRGISVADVIERIATAQPRIVPQRLLVSPSGEAKLAYSKANRLREQPLVLHSGELLRQRKEPEWYVWMRKFHRSLLLGENGRIFPAIAAVAMLLLSVTGAVLLLRRLGGVRQFFAPASWHGWGNSHAALGRLALLPLLVTVITALWLSAVTFDLVSAGSDKPPAYPESREELDAVPPWTLQGLKELPMSAVREIVYPIPDDWFDVWTVRTDSEYVFIDQFSGAVLSRESLPLNARIMDWVMLLHTGEGSIGWALVLLIASLTVPYFAVSGMVVWWQGRKLGRGRLRHQSAASEATVLLLVGSEGGSTWGFAKALHAALHHAGERVRSIEMNALASAYPKVHTVLVFAATYGDGDAPQSATRFVSRLAAFKADKGLRHATLAFGDRAFPKFCAFGETVNTLMTQRYGAPMLPLCCVDKQSSQTFSQWCGDIGALMNKALAVNYVPKRPKTRALRVGGKEMFGEALDAPLAVLHLNGDKLPRHQPGDWLAVYPPACPVPRLYSLASHARYDAAVEICVRRQEGGLCSPWLCGLSAGDVVEVTVVPNPRFHLPKHVPVVLIGAGTGIAPFVGMVRHNRQKRKMDLFWGGRDPAVDGLYGAEIEAWLADGRLTGFYPAWSRVDERLYVQDVLGRQRDMLTSRLQDGAVLMICGGREMAAAVCEEIAVCAQAAGLSLDELKRRKRLLEDVY